eukprot:CAMPEP_0183292562 /NCGR_PEP_ID=MMETSP0160_2-20130417/1578_1 /TAXON_ID=2839 ORGANISM="Odontella Sinensis, Strain Grunow 1884" /NCGR_SAMPLE_ID=MMETSP0160_2 /ASSEMBLY_ACC=CAM_ASM_000250 /LENGTH=59 /DNA_ID=CAMNT_0025453531 /DNA_START=9 /DNA_END=184 /DNA_ORIENTATION=+
MDAAAIFFAFALVIRTDCARSETAAVVEAMRSLMAAMGPAAPAPASSPPSSSSSISDSA